MAVTSKERLKPSPETGPIVDRQKEVELPPEVRKLMKESRKIEAKEAVRDSSGQVVMQPAAPAAAKVQLPMTRSGFVAGAKKKVSDAGKWFAAFVLRLIKKNKGEVEFKPE